MFAMSETESDHDNFFDDSDFGGGLEGMNMQGSQRKRQPMKMSDLPTFGYGRHCSCSDESEVSSEFTSEGTSDDSDFCMDVDNVCDFIPNVDKCVIEELINDNPGGPPGNTPGQGDV